MAAFATSFLRETTLRDNYDNYAIESMFGHGKWKSCKSNPLSLILNPPPNHDLLAQALLELKRLIHLLKKRE